MPELMHTLEEIRQYHGRALLGHLNLSVNLMLKPAPADWTTPPAAITMKHGDCKSYSIASRMTFAHLVPSAPAEGFHTAKTLATCSGDRTDTRHGHELTNLRITANQFHNLAVKLADLFARRHCAPCASPGSSYSGSALEPFLRVPG